MTRQELLEQYNELEDRIEDAATTEVWALADWLFANVPPSEGGAGTHRANRGLETAVTLADLAEARGRDIRYLQSLRQVAEATSPDRLPGVSPRAYRQALQRSGWDLAEANTRLQAKGSKLRDHSGRMMSAEALKAELAKQPDVVAEVATEALRTPEMTEQVLRGLNASESTGLRQGIDKLRGERTEAYLAEHRDPMGPNPNGPVAGQVAKMFGLVMTVRDAMIGVERERRELEEVLDALLERGVRAEEAEVACDLIAEETAGLIRIGDRIRAAFVREPQA